MERRLKCLKCGCKKLYSVKCEKVRCVSCCYEWIPGRFHLHLTRGKIGSMLYIGFLRGFPEVTIAQQLYDNMKISHINIGCGIDITIAELSNEIAKIVEYNGKKEFDTSQPDGTTKKLLDVSRLNNLGWQPSISLEEGIKLAYGWYLKNVA